MNQKISNLFLLTSLVILMMALNPITSFSQNNPSVLYQKVEKKEIQKVIDNWKSREVVATDWFVVFEKQNAGRSEFVVEYKVNKVKEYALLSVPVMPGDTGCGLGVLLYLHGGEDGLKVNKLNPLYSLIPADILNRLVIVAPAFRSEDIKAAGQKFISDSEKSLIDYDVDDALGILNLCFQNIPYLNEKRIIAFGISRGANTALRFAARYPKLNKVVAVATFTNAFHPLIIKQFAAMGRKPVEAGNILQEMHNSFLVPYFDKKITTEELRYELLLRSPGYFYQFLPRTILIHGTDDSIVPYSQSEWLDSVMNHTPDTLFQTNKLFYSIPGGGHATLDEYAKKLVVKELKNIFIPQLIKEDNYLKTTIPADSFQWYVNDLPIEQSNKNSMMPVNPGQYKLKFYQGKCQYYSKPIKINLKRKLH